GDCHESGEPGLPARLHDQAADPSGGENAPTHLLHSARPLLYETAGAVGTYAERGMALAAAMRFSAANDNPSTWPSSTSSCSMLTAISGLTFISAVRKRVQYSTSWPFPIATNSHGGFSGKLLAT